MVDKDISSLIPRNSCLISATICKSAGITLTVLLLVLNCMERERTRPFWRLTTMTQELFLHECIRPSAHSNEQKRESVYSVSNSPSPFRLTSVLIWTYVVDKLKRFFIATGQHLHELLNTSHLIKYSSFVTHCCIRKE